MNDSRDKICKTVFTKTLAENDCEMVIFTNFLSWPEEIALRRAVILKSRVHSGERNASLFMHGHLITSYLKRKEQGTCETTLF